MKAAENMVSRFCLDEFLARQAYLDPFIILALREKGLSFARIGLLIGLRYLVRTACEVPGSSLADLLGKRRTLLFALPGCMAALAIFGLTGQLASLAAAAALLGLADALRTGTQAAIVHDWAQRRGTESDPSRLRRLTARCAGAGTVVSGLVAPALVLCCGYYRCVFWFAMVPCALALLNALAYPRSLDASPRPALTPEAENAHPRGQVRGVLIRRPVRLVLAESVLFRGYREGFKDYLQPVAMSAALAAPVLAGLSTARRTALIIAVAGLLLHAARSWAARQALVAGAPDDERTAGRAWLALAALTIIMLVLFLGARYWTALLGFVALAALGQVLVPNMEHRIVRTTGPDLAGPVLAVEAVLRASLVMLLAPLLGRAVDLHGYWPLAATGVLISIVMTLLREIPPPGTRIGG